MQNTATDTAATTTTHHHICPLCEACCGLEIKVQNSKVISIRVHVTDVFSADKHKKRKGRTTGVSCQWLLG